MSFKPLSINIRCDFGIFGKSAFRREEKNWFFFQKLTSIKSMLTGTLIKELNHVVLKKKSILTSSEVFNFCCFWHAAIIQGGFPAKSCLKFFLVFLVPGETEHSKDGYQKTEWKFSRLYSSLTLLKSNVQFFSGFLENCYCQSYILCVQRNIWREEEIFLRTFLKFFPRTTRKHLSPGGVKLHSTCPGEHFGW